MIESPIRLTVSWMTDAITGLNAQLANVPRPGGESQAPAVLFYDELTSPWVARNMIHRDALKNNDGSPAPGVIIRFPELDPEGALRQPVLPEWIDAGGIIVPVAVGYARRKIASQANPADHAAMVREARQTMRTAVRVVAQHFANAHQTYTVDDCVIGIDRSGIQFDTRYVDAGDDEVFDRILIPFVVMDRWALGID